MNKGAYIISTGAYLPERIVTNEDLFPLTGLSPAEIEKRTGIKERRWASEKEATSDLATRACLGAIDMAQISTEEIGLIIVATSSQDMFMPSTACMVEKNLGIRDAIAFDINASCSGFIYALHTAHMFLKNGQVDNALVVAGEVKSKFIDPANRETSILFGDGAGGVVMSSLPDTHGLSGKIMNTRLYTHGAHWDLIHLPGGGSLQPLSSETLQKGLHTMQMDGKKVYKKAIKTMEETIVDAVKQSNLAPEDIDYFIFHQANYRLIRQLMERMHIPEERVPLSLTYCGNTSSASIPITLHFLLSEGRLRPGMITLMIAFGGGLSWGSSLILWE